MRNYREDRATRELLRRGIIIPSHEKLHDVANAFVYPPLKGSLGPENGERLGLHHFSVLVKLGFAKEYRDEIDQKMKPGGFDPETGQALVLDKRAGGFFGNLVASLDNLAYEINIIHGLGFSKPSTGKLFRMINNSRTKPDSRVAKLPPVFLEPGTTKMIGKIQGYRNYLTHDRIPITMTRVAASVSIVSGPNYARPTSTENPLHTEWHLPRVEKLDLLPSRIKPEDLDPDDAVATCQDLYLWTMKFFDTVYETLTEDFKRLP